MSKNNPVTAEFFGDELFPWLADTIGLLLDDDTVLDDGQGGVSESVIRVQLVKGSEVNIHISLPRADAARVIGKLHSTEESLYKIFRAILKNHGFNLSQFVIRGQEEQEPTPDGTVILRRSRK